MIIIMGVPLRREYGAILVLVRSCPRRFDLGARLACLRSHGPNQGLAQPATCVSFRILGQKPADGYAENGSPARFAASWCSHRRPAAPTTILTRCSWRRRSTEPCRLRRTTAAGDGRFLAIRLGHQMANCHRFAAGATASRNNDGCRRHHRPRRDRVRQPGRLVKPVRPAAPDCPLCQDAPLSWSHAARRRHHLCGSGAARDQAG